MKFLNRRFLASTAILGAMVLPTAAFAQLEDEIIVTATKREKTLQDTPIAVTAVSDVEIKKSQIREMRDLPLLATSLTVDQRSTSSQTVFTIRGIGTSGDNAGLEPSVGVFVDGVYRSRQAASIGDFPTVERVEILRGPQSSIYGKNTPAGVISVITKKPQYEFGYDVEATYARFNSRILKGSVTGPVGSNDTMAFRLSGNINKRDGLLNNLFDGRDVNTRDRYSLRGQFLYEPTDNVSVRIIGDFANIDEECCAAPFILNAPGNAAALIAIGATVLPQDPFSRNISFDGALRTQQDTAGLSAQVDIDLGKAVFTSISAVRTLDEVNDLDADFVDVNLTDIRQRRDVYSTYTQELRLTSTGANRIDWMVGAYYYKQNLKHTNQTEYGASLRPFLDLAAGGLVGGLEGILSQTQPGSFQPGLFFQQGQGLVASQFNQGTESFAFFGSLDWHVDDDLTVTTGLRWSTEDKDVVAIIDINDPFSSLNFTGTNLAPGQVDASFETGLLIGGIAAQTAAGFSADPNSPFFGVPVPVILSIIGPQLIAGISPAVIGGLQGIQFFQPTSSFSDTRSEDNVSGNVTVSYDWNDSINTYATYSRGYKAGGFNLSNGSRAGSRSFGDEISTNYELGFKTRFWDNRATVDFAAFQQTLDNFQSNAFNGASFDLTNAGSVSLDGFEVDAKISPYDTVLFTIAATYLDDKYDDFVNGPCTNGDTTASCLTKGTKNFTGRDLGSPKWNVSSTLTQNFTVGQMAAYVRGEFRYTSDQNLAADLDPRKAQNAYTIINASFGVGDEDGAWQLQFWGRNIFDTQYLQGAFNSVGQSGNFNGFLGDPATYGVTLRLTH